MGTADRDDRSASRAGPASTGRLLVAVVVVSFGAAALVAVPGLAPRTGDGVLRLEGGPAGRTQLPTVPRRAVRPAARAPVRAATVARATSTLAPAAQGNPASAVPAPASASAGRLALPARSRVAHPAPAMAPEPAPAPKPVTVPRVRTPARPPAPRPAPRRPPSHPVDVPVATTPPAAPASADEPGPVAQLPGAMAAVDEAAPGAVSVNTR
jgi:hypothetical protein